MIRLYLAAGASVALVAAVLWFGHSRYEAGAESVRTELRIASEAAADEARLLSRERASAAGRIDADVLAKKRAAADFAAAGHADGSGLRLALADRRQPAAGADAGQCSVERAYADRLADLLDSGSRLVEEGAGIAGDAVILLDGLRERAVQP